MSFSKSRVFNVPVARLPAVFIKDIESKNLPANTTFNVELVECDQGIRVIGWSGKAIVYFGESETKFSTWRKSFRR